MGQSSKRVADARSPSVSDRDDSKRRRRRIQEASPQTRYPTEQRLDKRFLLLQLFLDIEARFHEQRQREHLPSLA